MLRYGVRSVLGRVLRVVLRGTDGLLVGAKKGAWRGAERY